MCLFSDCCLSHLIPLSHLYFNTIYNFYFPSIFFFYFSLSIPNVQHAKHVLWPTPSHSHFRRRFTLESFTLSIVNTNPPFTSVYISFKMSQNPPNLAPYWLYEWPFIYNDQYPLLEKFYFTSHTTLNHTIFYFNEPSIEQLWIEFRNNQVIF